MPSSGLVLLLATEYRVQGGEAHISRPKDPDKLSDEQWADYLFLRDNTKGVYLERWIHRHGCRRWFNVARNTITNEIRAVYQMGAKVPHALSKPKGGAT